MTDYVRGGYIRPVPGEPMTFVALDPDEHVIRPDGTCVRPEHHHTGPVIDMDAMRAWVERAAQENT